MLVTLLLNLLILELSLADHSVTLDPDDKFHVSWHVNGEQGQQEIMFEIDAKTRGWVGLGFSPNGGMKDSDIIMAWVDADGEAFLQDLHANGNSKPLADVKQDVELLSASEVDGRTKISFKRKLNTCDEKDRKISSDTVRLIYAYGLKDPKDNILTSSDYHGSRRGVRSIYLLDPPAPTHTIPEDAITFDIFQDNYEIPSDDTTYHCSFHPLPTLNKKHHIIAAEMLVQPGNEAFLHHALLYECRNKTLEHLRGTNATSGICYTPEMPEFYSSCSKPFWGWAVGGTKFVFPENVGLSIGEEGDPEFLLMEIHYDNPEMKSGVIDSSKVRLTYTPNVREMDSAMFSIGDVFGIIVPPQVDDFKVESYCTSDCTEQWIPEEGITIYAHNLHSHLLGVGISVDWWRDGEYKGVLVKDDHYDFNFQETRMFEEPIKLYPGDSFKVTCVMDSSKRTAVTSGGLSSREEMCLAFFSYFPKRPISNCGTMPQLAYNKTHQLYQDLGVTVVENEKISTLISYTKTFEGFQSWNAEVAMKIQESISNDPVMNMCTNSDSTHKGTGKTFKAATEFDIPEDFSSDDDSDPCEVLSPPFEVNSDVTNNHNHHHSRFTPDDAGSSSSALLSSIMLISFMTSALQYL